MKDREQKMMRIGRDVTRSAKECVWLSRVPSDNLSEETQEERHQ